MKLLLRIVLILAAIPIAWFVGLYLERFTLAPLGRGQFEGTPVTLVAFVAGFILTLLIVLIVGNLLLSRYFRSKRS